MRRSSSSNEPVLARNRLSGAGFVVAFGVVSLLADFVYEGARSVVGPYLATLGAGAGVVGVVSGAGEAVALLLRVPFGVLSDRTRRYWGLSILGYLLTIASVPALALTRALPAAVTLTLTERLGKAVRTPARDTMLSHATESMGRGWGFAIHEAMDQTGAVAGPLVVALAVGVWGGYRPAFALLALPTVLAAAVLGWLRVAAPHPERYEEVEERAQRPSLGSLFRRRGLRVYVLFALAAMSGYASFALLSYHLQVEHVLPQAQIPLVYALAMGVDAVAALAAGRLYDRVGLLSLAPVPVLTAAVPFLSFSTGATLVWVGAGLWGVVMGIQESTMRAAVADLVPPGARGTAFGFFNGAYGMGLLAGGALIGWLYQVSIDAAIYFVVAVEAVASAIFVVLLRMRDDATTRGLAGKRQ